MPSELDALTAVRNRLAIRRDKHLKLASSFEEQIKNLDKIRGVLTDSGENLDLIVDSSHEHGGVYIEGSTEKRVPITRLINRFINESGKAEFTAAEAYNFIKAGGFPAVSYGSVYETLTRQVKGGKLSKLENDPNFKIITETETKAE